MENKLSTASELSKRVKLLFNDLIAHISDIRDSISTKIKNGEINNVFQLNEIDFLTE